MSNIAEQFSAYTSAIDYDALPDAVVHEVKRRVIDSLACAFGAWSSGPAQIVRDQALAMTPNPGSSGATVLGTNHKTSPDLAAFANGTMIRYLDFNDTYLSKEPAHPSDNISAALACAEAAGRSGADLITAIAIAYEIQCRLCDAASLRAHGWDHVTYGNFSATCASAKLLGLSEIETMHSLGIAGVAHNALRQTRAGALSSWKACAFANAARNGVFSAMLANRGMTGPAPIFEGIFGIQTVMVGEFDIPSLYSNETDISFKILEGYIKYYPVEYHAQSAVAAALEVCGRIMTLDDIKQVDVHSHDAAVDIIGSEPEKWRPTTRETADHSLPYIVAAALMDRTVTLDTFEPSRFRDPKLIEFVQKVKVYRDERLSSLYPNSIANRVTIVTQSGEEITAEVIDPRGHPNNPMTDAEVEQKFRTMTSGLLPGNRCDEALARLWKLEEMADASDVVKLFGDL